MHHISPFDFVLGIIFLTVVAPLWISAHYGTRWRKSRGISPEDEKILSELWESARRLESRVEGLEKVLDAQAPGWKGKP
jgi:phage shock protein B